MWLCFIHILKADIFENHWKTAGAGIELHIKSIKKEDKTKLNQYLVVGILVNLPQLILSVCLFTWDQPASTNVRSLWGSEHPMQDPCGSISTCRPSRVWMCVCVFHPCSHLKTAIYATGKASREHVSKVSAPSSPHVGRWSTYFLYLLLIMAGTRWLQGWIYGSPRPHSSSPILLLWLSLSAGTGLMSRERTTTRRRTRRESGGESREQKINIREERRRGDRKTKGDKS